MTDAQACLEHKEPLTREDRSALKMGFILIGIFTVVCIAVFSFMFLLILDMEKGWNNWTVWLVGAFAAIFVTVIIVQVWRVVLDLTGGEAVVLTGRITDKQLHNRSRVGKRGSSGPTKYYLKFADREIEVKYNHYNKANVADLVEIRYAPYSKHIFDVRVLEAETGPQETPASRFSIHEETNTLHLTDIDIATLRAWRRRAIGYRVLTLLITGYFFIPFAIQQLWGLVLLMSPMVLVFLFQLYKIIKILRRYRQDIESGIKIGVAVQVTDRQTIRRRTTKYVLSSDNTRVEVSREVYESVSVGDRITVYSARHTGWLIGVA